MIQLARSFYSNLCQVFKPQVEEGMVKRQKIIGLVQEMPCKLKTQRPVALNEDVRLAGAVS